MQLSLKYGFVFLCAPKTASTAIQASIESDCDVSFTAHPYYNHITAKSFNETFMAFHKSVLPNHILDIFCLIRNPLDWIESWYRFRTREVVKEPTHPHHYNYTGNISYNDFIEEYLSTGQREPYADIGTQSDFLMLEDNVVGVDYIFSMERMDLMHKYLQRKIGKNFEFPKRNVSPKLEVALDKNMEMRLVKFLERDIALYEFISKKGMFKKDEHQDDLSNVLEKIHIKNNLTTTSRPYNTPFILKD